MASEWSRTAVESPRWGSPARHTPAVPRLPAIASLLLALALGSAACGDDASTPPVAAPPATSPSAEMPDRTFAEPTEAAAAAPGDFVGRWRMVRPVKLPCQAAAIDTRVEVDFAGLVFPTPFLFDAYTFRDWEVEGNRLTTTLVWDHLWPDDQCISRDIKAVLDCSRGEITVLVDGNVPEHPLYPVGIRRTSGRPGGPCTY